MALVGGTRVEITEKHRGVQVFEILYHKGGTPLLYARFMPDSVGEASYSGPLAGNREYLQGYQRATPSAIPGRPHLAT